MTRDDHPLPFWGEIAIPAALRVCSGWAPYLSFLSSEKKKFNQLIKRKKMGGENNMAFGIIQNAIPQLCAILLTPKRHNGGRWALVPSNTGNIDETQPETKRYASGNITQSAKFGA